MDPDGKPPARDAATDPDGPGDFSHPQSFDPNSLDSKGFDPKGFDPRGFDKRRRARNWALLAVLLGLSALFYAITLVKLSKGG
jgi:hypothetical protein